MNVKLTYLITNLDKNLSVGQDSPGGLPKIKNEVTNLVFDDSQNHETNIKKMFFNLAASYSAAFNDGEVNVSSLCKWCECFEKALEESKG